MEAPVEHLVEALCARCSRQGVLQGAAVKSCSEVEVLPPAARYGIAEDIVRSLSYGARVEQMNRLLRDVLVQDNPARTATLVCTATALVASCGIAPASGCAAGRAFTAAWEADMERILMAQPAFPEDVRQAVYFSVALLAVRSSLKIGGSLLTCAAATLANGVDSEALTVSCAFELLAAAAALLAQANGCREPEAAPAAERAPLSVPELAHPGREAVTTTLSNLSDLKVMIVDAAVQQLAQPQREAALPTRVIQKLIVPLLVSERCTCTHAPYIQKRVTDVIGILAEKGLSEELVLLIAALFDFLFDVPPEAPTATHHDPSRPDGPVSHTEKSRGSKKGKTPTGAASIQPPLVPCDAPSPSRDVEVVPWAGPASDFRCSQVLWTGLRQSLWNSIAFTDGDAGRRATSQLRVIYLLKRIVFACNMDERLRKPSGLVAVTRTAVSFHPLFAWITEGNLSSQLWEQYFIVLESLSEYGLHMVFPILAKVDFLVQHVGVAFSGYWLEMLFLKMIVHPNVGVRKVGLWKLWQLSPAVLVLFSRELLFDVAFRSAADPRLCSEIDRAVGVSGFLESKAYEGLGEKALPRAAPIAEQIDFFYSRLFHTVLPDAPQALAVASRVEALTLLLDTVDVKAARFSICVVVRVIHCIASCAYPQSYGSTAAEPLRSTACSVTAGVFGSSAVLAKLSVLLREVIQRKTPCWLAVRLTAVLFDALLHVAALDPVTLRQNKEFWATMAVCGPRGNLGGAATAVLDACGDVSSAGGNSGIAAHYLNHRLISLSAATHPDDPSQTLLDMLDPTTLMRRVEQFLRARVLDVGAARELFFLVGALAPFAADSILIAVAGKLQSTLQEALQGAREAHAAGGFVCRTSALDLATVALCFIEFHHSIGSITAEKLVSAEELAKLFTLVVETLLRTAHLALESLHRVHYVDDLGDSGWALLRVDEWDAVTAVVVSILQIQRRKAGMPSVSPQLFEYMEQAINLLALLRTPTTSANASASGSESSPCQAAPVAQQMALAVLARNTARLLQAFFAGLLPCDHSDAEDDGNGNVVPPKPTMDAIHVVLGTTTSVAQRPAGVRVGTDNVARLVCAITSITQILDVRQRLSNVPTCLTTLEWSVIQSQYAQYLYTSMLLLCGALFDADPQTARSPAFATLIQSFCLAQLDTCWTSNVVSVCDILMWLLCAVDNAATDGGVDPPLIVTAMFSRANDAGSRDHFRMMAMAFNALRYCIASHPEMVQRLVYAAVDDNQESERCVYFATLCVAAEVLKQPDAYWETFQDVLLHIAVLFNSGHDEDEAEACLAAIEPMLLSWSPGLRAFYPPSVRTSAVARCMAIATILDCCSGSNRQNRAKDLTLKLLKWNSQHPTVSREPCMPNSKAHRCRIRLWQLLCSLIPLVGRVEEDWTDIASELINTCVHLPNLGSVRRLMELYAINLFQMQPVLFPLLDKAMGVYTTRAQVSGTYALLASHVLLGHLQGASDVNENLLRALLDRLIQLSASHQHLIRIITHAGLYRVYAAMIARGIPTSTELDALYDFIAHAPDHVKNRTKHDHFLFFDAREACSPFQLFCVQRKEAMAVLKESMPSVCFERIRYVDAELRSGTGAVYAFDKWRVIQMSEQLQICAALRRIKAMPYIPHTTDVRPKTPESPLAAERVLFFANHAVAYTEEVLNVLVQDALGDSLGMAISSEAPDGGSPAQLGEGSDRGYNIQRKVGSWWTSEVYNELHPRSLRNQRQSIVVVGSLLENPVNIAGLCRCGEIFSVEKIVIPERKVFEHPHFVAAARSAELWIPWEEVAPRDLAEYLQQMRFNGYTLVGIEQTSDSVSIGDYAFPERAVMVLGAEGQGIPPPILLLLDVCVEIPQYGLIRSLNVHVTGAVVMYEYTRQRLMPQLVEGTQRHGVKGVE